MARGVYLSAALAGAVALTAGCGGGAARQAGSGTEPLPVLSTVPGLVAKDRVVDATVLSHDAPVPSLPADLARWGFVAGHEREFTGATKTFTDVVSRTLLFRRPAGARAYVTFVAAHAASFYGRGTAVRAVTSAGRPGYLLRAASCGCHRESPILLTVVWRGKRVSWLVVNGPGATAARAQALAARMP